MDKVRRFLSDAGGWGLSSMLAALVSLGISVWERIQNASLSAYWFLFVAAVLWGIGCYKAWSKRDGEFEKLKSQIDSVAGPKLWLRAHQNYANFPVRLMLESATGELAYNVAISQIGKGEFEIVFNDIPLLKEPTYLTRGLHSDTPTIQEIVRALSAQYIGSDDFHLDHREDMQITCMDVEHKKRFTFTFELEFNGLLDTLKIKQKQGRTVTLLAPESVK